VQVLRTITEHGVVVFLLRAPSYFAAPYATGSTPWARLLPAMLLPRAALLLLHWLHRLDPTLRPTAIISNDWVGRG